MYPDSPAARSAWIRARRPSRREADPWRPQGYFLEVERSAAGEEVTVATVLITNRECPWRCVMCDLWRGTTTRRGPAGAIAAQVAWALERLGPARQLKLYNSGSFFDVGAIPPEEHPALAVLAAGFERVVVESHPALIGPACVGFRDRLRAAGRSLGNEPQLEVAMGLETVHAGVLERLNKRLTLDQFAGAAGFLRRHGVALRVFVLVQPPFLPAAEALFWAERSVDFAFSVGASVVTLIPTRAGNGALEALAAAGEFEPPRLATLEAALDYGVGLGRGRVFADLWDLERWAGCGECFAARAARLRAINGRQAILPPVRCLRCG